LGRARSGQHEIVPDRFNRDTQSLLQVGRFPLHARQHMSGRNELKEYRKNHHTDSGRDQKFENPESSRAGDPIE